MDDFAKLDFRMPRFSGQLCLDNANRFAGLWIG